MNRTAFLSSVAAAVLLAGCSHNPTVVVAPGPSFVPIESVHNVRVPEGVKAYPVDRYVDPNTPDLMHERHIVYRIERPADWRLQTSAERQILVGNTMTDADLEKNPMMLQDELSMELSRQRLYSKAQSDQIGNLIAATKALEERAHAAEIAVYNARLELEAVKKKLGTTNAPPATVGTPALIK